MNKFLGAWKVIAMEPWDREYIDLVEDGYINFNADNQGEFVFGTVNGYLDCRFDQKKNPANVEFSWEKCVFWRT